MIVAVDPKRQKPPPEGFNICDNFIWIPKEFDAKNLTNNPNCPHNDAYYCQCLTQGEVVAVVVYSVVGFFLLAVTPIACCCRYCYKYRKLKKLRVTDEHTPLINDSTKSET